MTVTARRNDRLWAISLIRIFFGVVYLTNGLAKVTPLHNLTTGVVVTRDDLHPEPAVAVDGVWWHPVAIADPAMRLEAPPLPIAAVFEEVQRALAHRAARGESVRRAFRCA